MNKITKTVILNSGDPEEKREEILQYFYDSFDIDTRLYDTLKRDESFYLRADPLRHPLIFYFGHTAAFYINKLILAKLLDKRIDPDLESAFSVGVDEMSWDDLNEANYDWPMVDKVREYRNTVRQTVSDLIKKWGISLPISWDNPFWVIMMGIEHSRIHLETSSVLIRQLPISEVKETELWPVCPQAGPAPENQLLEISEGEVKLGKTKHDALYGWDNEYGDHSRSVASFKAARYLVSNGEYLKFVEDQGYQKQEFWTEEGWQWKKFRIAEHPHFWIKASDGWKFRTMVKEIDMPWNWPVEVNYLEAKAFCNWLSYKTGKTLRLPTEEEWYRFYDQQLLLDQPYWKKAPGNINLEGFASSVPVNTYKTGDFYDVIGNVWQWTETPITGFQNFEVHPFYDDFSTPTFDGRHNLIKGGSWISTGNEATRDARYAFRRHFFQHAGFRYIETEVPVETPEVYLETEPDVTPYCEMHWTNDLLGLGNFPRKLAEFCLYKMAGRKKYRVLDIGCKVGRTAFELAREFNQVIGLDFTARHLKAGVAMRDQGYIRYSLVEEGELVSYHEKKLKDFELSDFKDKVEFLQGDISNLIPKYTGYDLVLVENMLEETYEPAKFLAMIHERINPAGTLIIASSYNWNKQVTEPEKWLGGFRLDGEPSWSWKAVEDILNKTFTQEGEPLDLPWVIRKHGRHYSYLISQISVWRKNT